MDLEETSIDWSSIPAPRTSSPVDFKGFSEPSAILEETEAGSAMKGPDRILLSRWNPRLVEWFDWMSTRAICQGQ
eukprot:Skav214729  [mRNA]  locus=scaffold2250:501206:501430:+ [translate_table: standard]